MFGYPTSYQPKTGAYVVLVLLCLPEEEYKTESVTGVFWGSYRDHIIGLQNFLILNKKN